MKLGLFVIMISVFTSCSLAQYKTAFMSDRDSTLDIYLKTGNDTLYKQLTKNKDTEYNMVWGNTDDIIYYTHYKKNDREILSIDIKTGIINSIINDTTVLFVADISADDSILLFSSKEDNRKGELFLYSLSDKSRRRITNNNFYESGAKFSPADNNFVASSIQTAKVDSLNHGGNAEIFLINISDSTLTQLTDIAGFSALPSISPDGKQIAFHNCNNGQCDIYLVNVDGTNLKNLTNGIDDNRWPRWTPDGKWIAFTKTISDNSEIYLISPDGKVIKPFITSPFRDETAEFKYNQN